MKTLISCTKALREAQEKLDRLTLSLDDEDLHYLSKNIALTLGYANGCLKSRGEDSI